VRVATLLVLPWLLAACATTMAPPPAGAPATAAPAAPAVKPPVQHEPPASEPALAAVEPQASNRERLQALIDISNCRGDQRKLAGPFQPRHLQRLLEQRNDLFSWVVAELHARKLPGQFVAMPVLESAYQADPGNRGAVRGLWQFAAATARRFGLQVDGQRDDRLSALASTHAALDHLGEMWQRWGDWRLAVVGFNAGEYAVTTALRRDPQALEQRRLPRSLPGRALQYAQRAQAVACLLLTEPDLQPWRQGVGRQQWRRPIQPGLRSLDDAATWLGSDRASLLRLNPELARRRFPLQQGEPVLALAGAGQKGPPALAAAVAQVAVATAPAAATTETPPAQQRVHVVARGDSPWTIARKHRIALRDLLHWNRLQADSVLQPGQRLRLEP
jgi:membrane-bound lytic murein transglycosylase D